MDHHALWIDPDDSQHLLLGNDGGLHISYDAGATWEHQYHPVGQFYEVNIDSTKTPYHVCGGLQDNGVWCGPVRTRERVGITNADWYAVGGGDGFRSAGGRDSRERARGSSAADHGRPNTRLALTPPKPKPFEMAYCVDSARAVPVTMSRP